MCKGPHMSESCLFGFSRISGVIFCVQRPFRDFHDLSRIKSIKRIWQSCNDNLAIFAADQGLFVHTLLTF